MNTTTSNRPHKAVQVALLSRGRLRVPDALCGLLGAIVGA